MSRCDRIGEASSVRAKGRCTGCTASVVSGKMALRDSPLTTTHHHSPFTTTHHHSPLTTTLLCFLLLERFICCGDERCVVVMKYETTPFTSGGGLLFTLLAPHKKHMCRDIFVSLAHHKNPRVRFSFPTTQKKRVRTFF